MHLSIAHVCFTALDLGAAVCKQAGSRRLRADSWPRAASPLRGSRWVSGNWVLKSGPACMECPLGPGRAPAPGELARAERLHSSTGRPDSSATLQTSLRPRLEAQTARWCGARPVPDSQTCRFYDSPWQSRHQQNCCLLRDLGSARPSAREQDLDLVPLASHWTSGALSFLGPAGYNFALTGSRGVLGTGHFGIP